MPVRSRGKQLAIYIKRYAVPRMRGWLGINNRNYHFPHSTLRQLSPVLSSLLHLNVLLFTWSIRQVLEILGRNHTAENKDKFLFGSMASFFHFLPTF
jgi:hypothetical protein